MKKQNKTINIIEHLREYLNTPEKGTIAYKELLIGLDKQEPIIYGLLQALQYAMAYEKRYVSKLCEDFVLGSYYLSWIGALRGLLNGIGAVAMELENRLDSKDNGWCESLFWECMKASGFKEGDLDKTS